MKFPKGKLQAKTQSVLAKQQAYVEVSNNPNQ
jgi:hypothetical protein